MKKRIHEECLSGKPQPVKDMIEGKITMNQCRVAMGFDPIGDIEGQNMTIDEAIKEIKDASDAEVRFGDIKYHFVEVMKRVEAFEMAIQALEQTRWIPVSERLPELDENQDKETWEQKVMITGYLSFDNKKELFVSEALISDVINNRVQDTVVTAWMPLPEPYRAESEE